MKAANDNAIIVGDLLVGAPAIAKFLGVTQRQVYRLTYDGLVPHFKLGGSVSARRSTLAKWLAEQEAAA
ncbi:helix-turn-helix transcriptional regulator [Hoeflea sp. Naph1]|uniref:helix-turn-helix transcriptional regulator n=1 Tax=Hoeflea sp. Naph1 TaxID=3388653 RepID=UPI00398FF489